MYGWLLESVQHFVVQECGEEIWESILSEAGARNTVFSATQQYPDALMLRIASSLAELFSKGPNSPTTVNPEKSSPKRPSLKSKQNWRSASVNADYRTQAYKCPFSATNALTAVTKKEIGAYSSTEEIRLKSISNDKISEESDTINRIIEAIKNNTVPEITIKENDAKVQQKNTTENPHKSEIKKTDSAIESTPSTSTDDFPGDDQKDKEIEQVMLNQKRNSLSKISTTRKNSCNLIETYRRRGSGTARRVSLNCNVDRYAAMKEKFGTPEKVMHFFGRCFVKFFSNYGYDTMIRATGRYFCTFLQSVDSIHQRMRFTFPRMRSPCMQLTRAHRHGAELVYSSTRFGFTHYLMGQLYEIAEDIFSLKLKVTVVKESQDGPYYVAVLRLEFDNNDYVQSLALRKATPCPLPPVPVSLLLQLFPFGALLDRRMRMLMVGEKLAEAWGGPCGRIKKAHVSEILRLRKPKVSFTWEKVVCMQTMLFELELVRWVYRGECKDEDARRGSHGARAILLKGPIYLLEEIDALVFLCSPIFNNLEELSQAGLYLADLNGHGLSREMLLRGWQHLSRLELLFEKAESRSRELETTYRLEDQWKKQGDQLLYSMIPKPIADHLRDGKDPLATCQAFDSVTIIFCGVQLTQTGTRADVTQTFSQINDVYSSIDRLLDSHRVYKVETVGTVYMAVSGAPTRRRAHAPVAASAALSIARAFPKLTIGVHSGPVVAGVLGLKLPRYCLVGDTVNTASRMQTTCEPGRIQVSAATAAQLPAGRFRLRRRGLIKVKGKGMMETFWLEGEIEEEEQQEALQLFSALFGDN